MQDFLLHLQAKAYQNRTIAIVQNGSWAPTAGRVMKGIIETFKNIDLVEDMVTIKSTLKPDSEKALEELAEIIANK